MKQTLQSKLIPLLHPPIIAGGLASPIGRIAAGFPLEAIEDPQRNQQAMDSINTRYGPMTLASARLLDRSSMPDVISPAWKPEGHRKSL